MKALDPSFSLGLLYVFVSSGNWFTGRFPANSFFLSGFLPSLVVRSIPAKNEHSYAKFLSSRIIALLCFGNIFRSTFLVLRMLFSRSALVSSISCICWFRRFGETKSFCELCCESRTMTDTLRRCCH